MLHTGYDVSVARPATAIVVTTWVVRLSYANEHRLTRVAALASIASPVELTDVTRARQHDAAHTT